MSRLPHRFDLAHASKPMSSKYFDLHRQQIAFASSAVHDQILVPVEIFSEVFVAHRCIAELLHNDLIALADCQDFLLGFLNELNVRRAPSREAGRKSNF